jgi:hypothetical protein
MRDGGDLDLLMSMPDLLDFVEKQDIDASPVSKTKFSGTWCGGAVHMHVARPFSLLQDLLEMARGDIISVMGQNLFLPTLDWLYTIKMSHRYQAYDPGFLKTMRDIREMRYAGAQLADYGWLMFREHELETEVDAWGFEDIQVSRSSVFAQDRGRDPYDREELLELVKIGAEAMSDFYTDDAGSVVHGAWERFDKEAKVNAVVEECYVLALERCLIRKPTCVSPDTAFLMALEAMCTDESDDDFREFAWENFHAIVKASNNDYLSKFLKAVDAGTLVKPTAKTPELETQV